MDELKIDNPAQRLLDLLEQGKKYKTIDNCRKVWRQILQVEGMEEQHLLTRLAHAMTLPGRIIQVREDNFSTLRGNSNHWKSHIDKAFVSQSLNSEWSTFWRMTVHNGPEYADGFQVAGDGFVVFPGDEQ